MDVAANGLVIDANILIDAVLGTRVRAILEAFEDKIRFFCPDVCVSDARRNIPTICERHGLDELLSLRILQRIEKMLEIVALSTYATREPAGRERIHSRDPDDWPVIAAALALDLPIWTEDRDFFGCGVATWITNTVEIYLRA
jgi:predicted nucleic acid-binding protein